MNRIFLVTAAATLMFTMSPAIAGDAQAGKAAAPQCATCHGQDGIAMAPDAPNLAGQPEVYLAEQLQAYRAGERGHEQMSLIAADLTDDEIADLAAYYAAIEISATIPEYLQ